MACPRLLLLAGALCASTAGAQVSGTLSAISDYRYRGVSLSQQKPAAQASIGYDDPRGFYGGLFGSTVEFSGATRASGQALGYLGWVTPLGGGFHLDLGGDYSAFTDGHEYDFGEIYAGMTASDCNVRLHYSPNYFGAGQASWYAEINGSIPLASDFSFFAHLGVLVPIGQGAYSYTATVRNPVDARVGISHDFGGLTLQLAWVAINGYATLYPLNGAQRRNTGVASVAWSF